MSSGHSITTYNCQSPAKRFKLSFGLRTLLAFIFVCAAAAWGWAQFAAPQLLAEKQRRFYARLRNRGFERLGGRVSNRDWRHRLTSDDVALLSEIPNLAAIKWGGCDDETLRHLRELKQVQSLDLEFSMAGGRDVTAEGLKHLAELPDLRTLRLFTYMLTNEETRWLDTVYPWNTEQQVNALLRIVKIECDEASLEEFVLALTKAWAPVTVKSSDLEVADRLPVAPITARYPSGAPLRQVLDEVLEPRRLGWAMSNDRRGVSITTKDAAQKEKDRLQTLEELRKSSKCEVLRADTFGRRMDAYSVPMLFNKHTFESFEQEFLLRR